MITSSQNPRVKLARALLGRPKERRAAGAFVAEGVRLVEDAFDAGWQFRYVLFSQEISPRGFELMDKLQRTGVEVDEVPPELLQTTAGTETPQGVLAVLELNPLPVPETPTFLLIPDQIRDPGNLGTLLRAAAAAGADAALIPPETVDAFAPKVVRAGMGAHFRLPVLPATWDEINRRLDGFDTFLADAGGSLTCWQADFTHPTALILGGEADGASATARELATTQISIPMPGRMESLNAGVAGAILLFEVVRQRTKNK